MTRQAQLSHWNGFSIPVSYPTSIRATVLFTSLIKCVSLNSVLNVVSSVILCRCDGVPGRSVQDTGVRAEKKVGNRRVRCITYDAPSSWSIHCADSYVPQACLTNRLNSRLARVCTSLKSAPRVNFIISGIVMCTSLAGKH